MSVESTLASKAGQSIWSELQAACKRFAAFCQDTLSGEWVTRETWHARTGVTEKTFANGLRVVEAPGAKPLATVPDAWLADQGGVPTIKQLREGSWVRSETWHARTGVTEKTFQNGVHVTQVPGQVPSVLVPQRILTKGAGKI